MKQTLLTMVQKILSDMDSEEVNSVNDTIEAQQVASIVEDTYYNIITNREIGEHQHLIKLTAASNNLFPTHFEYPTNVNKISRIDYDTSSDSTFAYTEVRFLEPLDFLSISDAVSSNYDTVDDRKAGTKLRIRNDKMPEYWTSFDDENIVMDSYDSAVDTTLQESKTRAMASKTPVFDRFSDTFIPELDANLFPLLLAESKSVALSLLKGNSDPKIDQAARRNRYHFANDKYKTNRAWPLSRFGR
jgi:hypothetical protein